MVIQEPGQRPQEEEPKGRKEGGEVKVADVYEVPPVNKVTVTGDMCSLTDHQDSQADINVSSNILLLFFFFFFFFFKGGVCLLVVCLTSQQHASVSRDRSAHTSVHSAMLR